MKTKRHGIVYEKYNAMTARLSMALNAVYEPIGMRRRSIVMTAVSPRARKGVRRVGWTWEARSSASTMARGLQLGLQYTPL